MPVIPIILAALPEIALAIALTLLVFAVAYLINAIGSAIGSIHIPVISVDIPIGRYFARAADGVVNIINSLAQPFAHPFAAWLIAADYSTVGIAQDSLNVAEHQATLIAHLHNVTIPDERAAAEAAAAANTAIVAQGIRTQIHAAETTWEHAHSYADAVNYINQERAAPSVEHAQLALNARTLIASETHAQDLHDQLKAYVDEQIGVAKAYAEQRIGAAVAPIEGAIAIPTGAAIPGIDVEDLIKDGAKIAVGTAVAVIATKIVDCLVSNCEGNNNFANLLKAALGIVDFATVAAFIEQVIQHPDVAAATASGDIQAIVAPLVAGGTDIVSELEGLFSL